MMSSTVASAGAVDALSSLLTIMADPKKHQEMLAEIKASIDEANKLHADITAAQAQAATDRAAVEQGKAEIKQLKFAHDNAVALLESRQEQVERAAADLAGKQKDFEQRDKALSVLSAQREATHARREATLKQRETAAAVAAEALDKRAAALAQKEADYAERIGKLKALAG